MKIGIVGPISTAPLLTFLDDFPSDGIPAGMGGTSITQIVAGYAKAGRSVVVFTVDPDVQEEVILTGPNLKLCVLPFRNAKRARDLFRVERRLLRDAIRRENPDIVNAHFTHLYAWAAQESGLPAIVTARDAPFRVVRYLHDPYHLVQLYMAVISVKRSQQLIVNSQHLADHYRRYFRFKGPITIIPNGFGDDVFALSDQRRQRRTTSFTFCAALIGWSKLKNGEALLKAFARVYRKHPHARLVLFGDGFETNGAGHQWARGNNISDGISFLGAMPQREFLTRMAQEGDVFVHTSLEESFGSAIGEAMAIGLPVIGGAESGAVPEVLGYGEAGLLVDVRSPDRIAEAMERLLTDQVLCDRLGKSSRDTAMTRFHIDRIVDQYDAVYATVAEPPDARLTAEQGRHAHA